MLLLWILSLLLGAVAGKTRYLFGDVEDSLFSAFQKAVMPEFKP
jgi:hypothetical protein